jgi:hypothetical protein
VIATVAAVACTWTAAAAPAAVLIGHRLRHLEDQTMSYPDYDTPRLTGVLAEIHAERARQDERWGEQNHPDGTGLPVYQHAARRYRDHADRAATGGHLAWRDVLLEEVYEALAETDPARLRAELVQVAAVAACWIECIDRRTATVEDADVVAYRTPEDVLTCIPCGKDIPGAVALADDDLPNGGLCRICDADVYCAAEASDRP